MDQYAVIGSPVKHSLSPQIHQKFAQQLGEHLSYVTIEASLEGFVACAREFVEQGGLGLNVTVPFKVEAFELADRVSNFAQRAQAVNTLYWQEGQWLGENTDGVGLVTDLKVHHHCEICDKRILIIGAGGAARGVVPALLAELPAQLAIANRTSEKAHALVEQFAKAGVNTGAKKCVMSVQPSQASTYAYDIVINATASSLSGSRPFCDPTWVGTETFGYDMMYGAQLSPFLKWLQTQQVAAVADGLGMLVEQAAASYQIWRGIRPKTAQVILEMRTILSHKAQPA